MSRGKPAAPTCNTQTSSLFFNSSELNRVERDARTYHATEAARTSWTLWTRLSPPRPQFAPTLTNYIRLEKSLLDFGTQLGRDVTGAAGEIGIHDDTDCLHAHALIFLPRRITDPFLPPGVVAVGSPNWSAWLGLWWPPRPARVVRRRHGRLHRRRTQPPLSVYELWVQPYDQHITERTEHGAGEYAARNPGSVMTFGTAPRSRR